MSNNGNLWPPAGAPFTHADASVGKVMMQVQIASILPLLVHIYYFGWGIAVQWMLAMMTGLVVEYAMLHLRGRPVKPFLLDGSAVITVTGLTFCIPPESPWWLIVVGVSFALIFGKHLYGGLGYNPFNPAMLGYAFLLVSFPAEMTQWTLPSAVSGHTLSIMDSMIKIFTGHLPQGLIDQVTGATPLDHVKTGLHNGGTVHDVLSHSQTIWNGIAGHGWIQVNIAFMLGGLYLLWTRTIRWQYPVGFLGTLALLAWIFHTIDPAHYAPPLFHLLSGGTMLAAFFIITDPVTAAATPKGRLIYAMGIGVLVYVIRTWGGYPDGIAFAVLLMNIFVPLIDQYTQPRVKGYSK
ncbi:electron transport complex protein RnfD [Sulfurivirga caldicuralii]|uniref:Ion-translocating oxidoreductase complex subunit D n=1 Tax=Sulfurivirga caldicuralii TaxID=364032 RepID=A0A1N6FJV5_9GAMM|nr:electron transport complex subunit RsxD [Sulfurivirga caldicuralii]SIN95500.1 electron transport complex protein RnfD [Sulfurivirga caldicuralii]